MSPARGGGRRRGQASTVAAVVLAAGGGTRFEGPVHKLLAPFRGRPLALWAVEAAVGAGLDETIVVTGAVDLEAVLPDGITILANHDWASGQASSLRTAVAWAQHRGHSAIVVGLGDQPLVPASAWAAVAACTSPIAVAILEGERRPPTRLGAEMWSFLPVTGDVGARTLIARMPDLVTEVACEGHPIDVDTLEDLERWS